MMAANQQSTHQSERVPIMAKKKGRTKSKKSTPRPQGSALRTPPSPKLLARLEEVDKLTKRRQWAEALVLLTELDRAYPNRIEVVGELVNLAYETNDLRAYQTHAERLVRLDPDNAAMLGSLAAAYLKNHYPFLTLTTLHDLVQRFPDHAEADKARNTIAALANLLADSAKRGNLADEIALDVMALNDRLRIQLQNEDLLDVRVTARKISALAPTFIPALNNLSLAEFMLGEVDRAIELAEQVLAQNPDNFQALSNLARFQLTAGRPDEANQTADHLLTVTVDNMEYDKDVWLKKAEALSYLGRHQDVLAVVDAAEAAGYFTAEGINPALYHYRAAAAARTGNTRLAKRAWQMALKLQPGHSLAAENLADLAKPVSEREGAWAFSFTSWISQKAVHDLNQIRLAQKDKADSASAKRATQRFIKNHPEVLALAPILMERGDPTARRVLRSLALQADTPADRSAVYDFVTGPHGPDALRAETTKSAMSKGILPPGMVSMWFDGKQKDVLVMGFTVTMEPTGQLSRAVESIFIPALNAFNAQDFEKGAQFLEMALQLAPDEPLLLNNLAMAYEQLGRAAESQAIQDRIDTEFPDYFFGVIARANGAFADENFQETRTLLDTLLSREKLHITEFRALAESFIRLFLAQDQVEGAEKWMEMWEGIEDDYPVQARLRLYIAFLKAGSAGPFGKQSGWLRDLLGKSLKDQS